ncbi:hypothetical protein BDW62DRAFT_207015 [Aspergillus aurantiobrunneus]
MKVRYRISAAVGPLLFAHTAVAWFGSSSDTAVKSKGIYARQSDGECDYVMIESGDTCTSIAKDKCKVDYDDFLEWNGGGDDSFCNTILPDEPICCSEGDLPDLKPQPDGDNCAAHEVAPDQLCYDIEQLYHLDEGDLDDFNKGKTWGWAGCGKVQKGMKICVSDGNPPMPAELENAICGPQVPGTEQPTNGTKIQDLNPCPLNVCCNIWGQCGTTEDFCIDTSIDDTPGTAEEGTFGCISNCGMEVTNNDDPPASYSKVAYFEAWNGERPCLHMDVDEIKAPYTHIHFAFGDISEDFVPSDNGVEGQFKRFKDMDTDLKRIISFGGWAFSNDPGTNHIIREGVKEANRETFADNVAKFVNDNGLDGVDFDWEYPGADDIPGSQPGGPEDGGNYLEFLKIVREKIGDKSLSIAAPASYWYLRNFPIKEIAEVVDYIIYMTYDLHGQWDVGNKFTTPQCPEGNCLRSHVNITETMNSLTMITKAGVKSNKIMVGVSSYGRSFKMSDAGCDGPMCTYLGERNESPAKPGECTETGGYISDYEIAKIKDGDGWTERKDEDSDSTILVYDEVEWVGYMSSEIKEGRSEKYKGLNFAGTSDWAVDLQGWGTGSGGNGDGDGDGDDDGSGDVFIDPSIWEDENPTITCQPPCNFILPPTVMATPTVITLPPYTTDLEVAWTEDGTITRTVQTTTITLPPITTQTISFWNQTFPPGDSFTFTPIPSILPPPIVITNDPNPESSEGVSHPPVTRTITPYPYPTEIMGWDDDDDDDDDDNDDDDDYGGPFPPVIVLPGPPGPICIINCGGCTGPFCGGGDGPCVPMITCPKGDDWQDPEDPDTTDPDDEDDDDDDDDDEDDVPCSFPSLNLDPLTGGPGDPDDPPDEIVNGEYPGPDYDSDNDGSDDDEDDDDGNDGDDEDNGGDNDGDGGGDDGDDGGDGDDGDDGDGGGAPEPNQQVEIFYVNYIDQILNQYEWWFFHRNFGETLYVCETENNVDCPDLGCLADGDDLENPPWPDGEWTMAKGDAKDCTYKSDGNGPGTLECPGKDTIQCEGVSDAEVLECTPIVSAYNFYLTVVCKYYA